MAHDLLFVDNDSDFLNRCKDIFADSPYLLHFARSGEQALRLLSDGLDPVVVIAGQSMAEMDGPTLLMQVQEGQPLTPLIMVAGECDPLLVSKAINNSGLFRYYTKEVGDDELKRGVFAAVSHYLHLKQSLQAAKSLAGNNDELGDLTFYFEKTVEDHTRKLQKSHDENVQLTHTLKRTVRELEGQDRVLRHLLTIHALEDTLDTILEVIDDVLSISGGVIHVKDENESLQQVCVFPKGNQQILARKPSQLIQDVIVSGRMEIDNKPGANSVSVAIPIIKEGVVLGGMEVFWDSDDGKGRLSEEELIENAQSIYIFTVHAAIAISDHTVSSDKSHWSKTLDDVLLDLME